MQQDDLKKKTKEDWEKWMKVAGDVNKDINLLDERIDNQKVWWSFNCLKIEIDNCLIEKGREVGEDDPPPL
jgi:hypothetical protein